ncbi:ribosome-associated protein [Polystyrenella longa]|uniref:Ribosome-associated protein n=1 Tax=Polystyrenella longa TaxID=2528007 RepID=A0A518CRI6_9PLAN|nr:RNA-binding S4 domain-containing protein [Polystyrenella longa]QDU81828.1 ribosome-associated protein [Polystyrenella longa]
MTAPSAEESIQLDQFLKLIGAVPTGGQAKVLIQGGQVLLNDQIETRRRKKLVPGDMIEVLGEQYVVSTDAEMDGSSDVGETPAADETEKSSGETE